MYTPGTIVNSKTERVPTKTKIVLLSKYIGTLVKLGIF